jgi:hypothetical protein
MSFKLTFNAADHEPWQGSDHGTPIQMAHRLWFNMTTHGAKIDTPAEAIQRAAWDPEVWHKLREQLQSVPDLSDAWKLATYNLWFAGPPKPPRKGQPLPTAYRDSIVYYIMRRLCDEYGFNPTQTQPDGGVACAAAVVAALPDTPSEGQVANIWSAAKAKSAK